MKIFSYIFIFLLVLATLSPIYAKGGNDKSNQYLKSSALSIAKIQLMQALDNHLGSTNFRPISPVLNMVSSNDQPKSYKDRKKAFFRSLILPGAGEYYLGKQTLAKAFFVTEITLWLSYFAFRKYGKWVRNDALAFAATHSGANIEGKPSQFFVDIGNYIDIYQYNDAKQRFGQFEKVYSDEDYFWSWDSNGNRRKFENMRIDSDRAFNRSIFVLGGIFANHLISAIHSSWQTHRYNKKLDQMTKSTIHIQISTNYLTSEFSLNIQKEF